MQEKETTTKNPIRNSLTKIPCRWSCEQESTRKRERRKGLLSQTHTHTCRRAPSHTHANHVQAKRTAATRRTTANIQIQIQVQNNNKINNSPGNWNWKVGAGGERESKTGRESVALLLSLPWPPSSSTCCPLLDACSNKFQILTNKTMVLLFTSEWAREQVRECVLWVLSGVWSEVAWSEVDADSHAHYSHSE